MDRPPQTFADGPSALRNMAEKFLMPKLSPTMEEGQISRWVKNEGDSFMTPVNTALNVIECEASVTNSVIRPLDDAEREDSYWCVLTRIDSFKVSMGDDVWLMSIKTESPDRISFRPNEDTLPS